MIPPAFVHDLLARTDLVEVVRRSVELKRAGAMWKGLCPFHAEKSPSFTVSPSRQTYHCFGCGAHGNAVGFLIEQHGMGFVDAVQDLAQQAGMSVPEDTRTADERAAAVRQKEERATLSEVLARAADAYRRQLRGSERAVAYLKGRGLSGEIAARFGLGYAADGWRGLASVFPSYDDPLLEQSGLVVASGEEAGDPASRKRYDRFRDRIMFPIRAVQGDVIGFGGRVIDSGEPAERRAAPSAATPPRGAASEASAGAPKYLNSPETPVFSKGRELYGLFEARGAIRQKGCVLVVEGYMDVVALAQAGFDNVVATLGTACTAEHVQKLVRFADTVVFSFDGDAAGRRAAMRALEASLPHASDTRAFRFLFLPDEHDPDSFVRELGAPAFEKAIADAVPLSRQLAAQAAEELDLGTAEGRARFLALAKPLWSSLPDGVLRRQLLADLAGRAAMAVDELARLWRAPVAAAARRPGPTRSSVARPPMRRFVLSPADQIARHLLLESRWWDALPVADHATLCALPGWHGELFRLLDRELTERGARPWAALRERLAEEAWADEALGLVDGHDRAVEPQQDDLLRAIAQLRQAQILEPARRVLQSAFDVDRSR